MEGCIRRGLARAAGGLVVLLALVAGIACAEAASGRRVALVIGNADYAHHPALKNPLKDVDAVAATLRKAGFEVIVGRNVDRLGSEEILKRFYRNLEGADASLLYYSGHAIQVADQNYLIPVDARLQGPHDLEFQAVSLANIFGYMQEHSATQLVFLDACRDNPFEGREFVLGEGARSRAEGRGLARVQARVGSLISYATEPGAVAYDGGEGGLSPFTASFVDRALAPNLEVRQLLTAVRRQVIDRTGGRQVPWESSSLLEDFYFVQRKAPPAVAPLHRVTTLTGQGADLGIPPPRSDQGDELTALIEAPPEKGRFYLDGRALQPGERFPASRLATLHFSPGDATPDDILLAGYRVENPWGGQARGLVAIQVTADPKLAALEEERRVSGARRAQETVREVWSANRDLVVRAPLGVGPVSLSLRLPPQDRSPGEALAVRVFAAPRLGVLRLAGRAVGEGATLTLSDAAHLQIEVPVGSEGGRDVLALAVEAPQADPLLLRVAVEPTVLECDRRAGAPLDRQGVAAGVLPNEIEPKAALEACRADIARHGERPRLLYQLGRAHLADRNASEAARAIDRAAAGGHVRALYQQGLMALNGVGAPPDRRRAGELFERAAAKGDPFAMHNWGKMLFHGDGLPADRTRGLEFLMRAAEAGHTFSHNELGSLFLSGAGLARDPERARMYFEGSAARRDIYGMNNLALLYLDGVAVAQDHARAADLFARADAGGHPSAPNNLGRMRFFGWGVARDPAAAAALYERAASRGEPYGALNRAWLALNEGPRDPILAARYYALAAALDRGPASAEARDALGRLSPGDKAGAAREIGRDLKLALPSARKGDEREIVAAVRKAKVAGQSPGTLDEALIALARERWIRDRPRFDLF